MAQAIDAAVSHAMYIAMLLAIVGAGIPPPDKAALQAAGQDADPIRYVARLHRRIPVNGQPRPYLEGLEDRTPLRFAQRAELALGGFVAPR